MASRRRLEVGSNSTTAFLTPFTNFFLEEFRIADSGMAWKGADSETITAMAETDIKWAQWIRVARGFQLRVGLKDHRRENFDGFLREVRLFQAPSGGLNLSSNQDHEKLASLIKNYFSITLETKEVSLRGWNWGVTDFQGVSCA